MNDTMIDPESLVTVARFTEPSAAQMAKGALEAAGIACFLHGEHANEMLSASFGARLQVHPQDEAVAIALLDEDGSAAAEAAEAAGELPIGYELPIKPSTAAFDDGSLEAPHAPGDTAAGDPSDV